MLALRIVLLGCLSLAVAAGAGGSTSIPVPSFAAVEAYPTGEEGAHLVGIADLNGDGAADAVALAGARLSVFLNRGNGALRPRTDYRTGPEPDAGALADLNGDRRPDLVTADRGRGGALSVLLNRGDGSFAARHDFPTGGGPQTLTIADVNGDGEPDAVDGHGAVVSVLLGKGDGTLGQAQDYQTGGGPFAAPVAVGDLNGDGKPDLAAAEGDMLVFLNRGDGTFEPAHDYTGGRDHVSLGVAIADLDGQRGPDLVTWPTTCCAPIAVFLNRGDGSFGAPREYNLTGGIIPAAGGGAATAQVADLNGDGRPDLVTRDVAAADVDGIGLSVLLNRGDGKFGSRRDYRVAGDLQSIAIGDLNGDGRPDVAGADSNSSSVALFVNKGLGRFQMRRDYPTDFLPLDIALADLNGDGRPDMLTTDDHSVSVLLDKPGLCNVQQVDGLRTAVAKWRLARVNCRAVVHRVFDPKGRWPKGGQVVGYKPSYGAVLRAGSAVRLTVRYGRRG